MRFFLFSTFLFIFYLPGFAQAGISVSPPRLYFEANQGQSNVQKVMISNVSSSHVLDLAISLGDWNYDKYGENILLPSDSLATSCASWVIIKKEDTYFSLQPGQNKEIQVTITTPNTLVKTEPVHTAMLYVTQMNPIDDKDSNGANIKVSVRSGIKLFHRLKETENKKIEIENILFNKEKKVVELYFKNKGNIWADGIVYPEFFNVQTGKKEKMEHTVFYSMPGDIRIMPIKLPENITQGKYIATIIMEYGDDNVIELGELSFTYE